MANEPAPQDKPWYPRSDWLAHHESLVERSRQSADAEILFLGDSITEAWLTSGSSYWESHFKPKRALNLGIGGDEIQHLHWRVQNGAGTGTSPKVVISLIGTNNIGNVGHDAATVLELLDAFYEEVADHWPRAKKLVHTIFPRDEFPGTGFRKEIERVNEEIHLWAGQGRFSLLDLYQSFLADNDRLPVDDFPDFLHLSEAAYGKWAGHLSPVIDELIDQ